MGLDPDERKKFLKKTNNGKTPLIIGAIMKGLSIRPILAAGGDSNVVWLPSDTYHVRHRENGTSIPAKEFMRPLWAIPHLGDAPKNIALTPLHLAMIYTVTRNQAAQASQAYKAAQAAQAAVVDMLRQTPTDMERLVKFSQNKDGVVVYNAVAVAIAYNNIGMLKYLMERCKAKARGVCKAMELTCLQLAVYFGRDHIVYYLVGRSDSGLNSTNAFGTPLYLAGRLCRGEIVRILIENGARPNEAFWVIVMQRVYQWYDACAADPSSERNRKMFEHAKQVLAFLLVKCDPRLVKDRSTRSWACLVAFKNRFPLVKSLCEDLGVDPSATPVGASSASLTICGDTETFGKDTSRTIDYLLRRGGSASGLIGALVQGTQRATNGFVNAPATGWRGYVRATALVLLVAGNGDESSIVPNFDAFSQLFGPDLVLWAREVREELIRKTMSKVVLSLTAEINAIIMSANEKDKSIDPDVLALLVRLKELPPELIIYICGVKARDVVHELCVSSSNGATKRNETPYAEMRRGRQLCANFSSLIPADRDYLLRYLSHHDFVAPTEKQCRQYASLYNRL